MSAESEGVAQCGAYGAFLCFVEGEVEVIVDVFVVVAFFVVDGGGDDVFLDGEAAYHGFNGSGCSEEVACHGLG